MITLEKALKNPATMVAKRYTQRLAKAFGDKITQTARALEADKERAAKQIKFSLLRINNDAMVKGTHQQAVAAATAPTRAATKTAASHMQAAMKGPPPGLQLRSVRVAPPDASNGPKQHGYGWRTPKTK